MTEIEQVELMLPKDVADLFRVDTKTVARWAIAGKLPFFWTPGGHRRYRKADIEAIVAARSYGATLAPQAGAAS